MSLVADILATVTPNVAGFFSNNGVLLLATCLPGLESPLALCRTHSNAVFSLFDSNCGKQTDLAVCWHQLHPQYPAREVFQLPTRLHGWGHWIPNCFQTPFKIPPILYIYGKEQPKNHQLFKSFYHWHQLQTFEVLHMLEMHSQLWRSHICDIYNYIYLLQYLKYCVFTW